MRDAFSTIFFDLDGVVVDSEVLAIETEIGFLSSLGLNINKEDYLKKFFGISNEETENVLEDIILEGELNISAGDLSRTLVNLRSEAYRSSLKEVPGAREFLEKCHLPKCLVTSSSMSSVINKLEIANIPTCLFDAFFSSDHVNCSKPSPEIYLLALDQMNVKPEHVLALEDSVNGVCASTSANIYTVGFLGGAHTDNRTGDLLVANGAHHLCETYAKFTMWFDGIQH